MNAGPLLGRLHGVVSDPDNLDHTASGTATLSIGQATKGRRGFIRGLAGAALSVLAFGAHAIIAAPSVSAGSGLFSQGCCTPAYRSNNWCPFICQDAGYNFFCWTCNHGNCRCCECTNRGSCWAGPFLCSYVNGCC